MCYLTAASHGKQAILGMEGRVAGCPGRHVVVVCFVFGCDFANRTICSCRKAGLPWSESPIKSFDIR